MDYPIDIVAILEYADAYSEKVCDQFFSRKEHIEGPDLKGITPVSQVNAFVVRTIFEAWRGEASQMHSPFFNYDSPDVRGHFNALMKALSGSVQISREHFEPILEEAVINTLRLAFRPTETLINYLRQLDKRIPIEQHLKPQLKYLRIHPEFLRALNNTLEAHEVVKRKHLLKAVEKLATNGHLFELPYNVMKQFNETLPAKISEFVPSWSVEEDDDTEDFLEYAAPMAVQSRNKEVDAVVLAESFAEKTEHYEQEEYLPEEEELAIAVEEDGLSEEEWLGDEERPLTEADLKGYEPEEVLQEKVAASAMERQISPLKTPESTPKTTDEPHVSEQAESIASEETGQELEANDEAIIDNLIDNEPTLDDIGPAEPKMPKVEKASIPSSKEEQPEQPAPSSTQGDLEEHEDLVADVEEEEEEDGKVGNDLHDKLKAQKKEEAQEESLHEALAEQQQPPKAKIKGTIPLNLKFRFLNELFGGDANAFEEAIDTIDGIEDYRTAIAVVKQQYMGKYDWDLGEDTTREFLSMVSRRYE